MFDVVYGLRISQYEHINVKMTNGLRDPGIPGLALQSYRDPGTGFGPGSATPRADALIDFTLILSSEATIARYFQIAGQCQSSGKYNCRQTILRNDFFDHINWEGL